MTNIKTKTLLAILSFLSLISLNSCVPTSSGPSGDIVYTQYKIPNLNLDFFADDRKDILIDYLTKSSEWHVFPIYNTLVAMRRDKNKTCDPVMAAFPSSYPYETIPALGDFLDLYSDTSKIRESNYIPRNMSTENSQITLMMQKPYYPPDNISTHSDILLSNLIIESKNKKLSLHSLDNSKDIHRPVTTKFLVSIRKELEKLVKFTAKGTQLTDESVLPHGSTRISPQPMMLVEEKSRYHGEYNVSGYLNPGQKGFVYLEVIYNKTSKKVFPSQKESTNAEYIGWSNNPNHKFNFCIGAKLRGSADNARNVPVDFQIWFKPEDRSPEKMLIQKTYLVDMSFR